MYIAKYGLYDQVIGVVADGLAHIWSKDICNNDDVGGHCLSGVSDPCNVRIAWHHILDVNIISIFE